MAVTILRRSTRSIARRYVSSVSGKRQLKTASSSGIPLTVGLRREDPTRIWERRCPLTPDVVHELVHKENVRVLVQNCERRIFPAEEFIKAGAEIRESLASAHVILGIKEVPLSELITTPVSKPGSQGSNEKVARTHLMFSHTAKGQTYNTPLLSRFMADSKGGPENALLPRLIDYEMLTGEDGKRTVGFGWFAGVAGALESLSAMAHSHLEFGVASPFLYTPRPHTHPSLDSLRSALRAIGETISQNGTPKSLGPFVIGLTGSGNVTKGCLSILQELPIVHVKVQDLPALVSDPDTDLRQIYLVHALPQDYLVGVDGLEYDRKTYYTSPDLYQSEFCKKVAPYLTLFLNGVGWSSSFPRLMSNDQLATALERAQVVGKDRFRNIGDISCDIEGGLQFLDRSSTLSEPFYSTRPLELPDHLPPVQIMAVDILPASIPLDASRHFTEALSPYIKSLISELRGQTTDETKCLALDRATIASGGVLRDPHQWLQASVDTWRAEEVASVNVNPVPLPPIEENAIQSPLESVSAQPLAGGPFKSKNTLTRLVERKKVLLLGSGMVAGPTVDELCKRPGLTMIVASNSLSEAEALTRAHDNATALLVDMKNQDDISALIKEADLVISLLPVPFHPSVAKLCIKHQTHLVTASYISPEMRALHDKALSSDVLLLNEIGLDPGIDHCSAISLLSDLRAQKKRVVSFTSFCGGLPAPECADVPLGYKFSWSPRGVLSAALNGAKFKLDGKELEIAGQDILKSNFPHVRISDNGEPKLEGIANRNSMPYAETYGLGPVQDIRTLLRGTLRYPGFCDLMHSFKLLGFLNTSTPTTAKDWNSFTRDCMQQQLGRPINGDAASVMSAMTDLVENSQIDPLISALNWLFERSTLPPFPNVALPPLDTFSILLAHKLRYGHNERDMVILHHEIVAESIKDGRKVEETYTSSLTTFGTPCTSAMSKCVGLPVAFAALQVLDGGVNVRGVVGPEDKSIYTSVLQGLDRVGLGMKEGVRRGPGMEAILTNHWFV